ncbi:MAG: 7-cyano-7-deazaguanine synthase [Pirellulaceae bacterium]
MSQPRLFICGGATVSSDDKRRKGRIDKELRTFGNDANVHLVVEDLCKTFREKIGDRIADLLDIAAYVYAADGNTERGHAGVDTEGNQTWSRSFHFVIPVVDIEFWGNGAVGSELAQLLGRLSNDRFHFDFVDRPSELRQQIFQYGEDNEWPFLNPERVLLFSGGLDSLAGAVETAAAGTNLVLVSHRSTPTMFKRQKDLLRRLQEAYPAVQILHIPVALNLKKKLQSREPTQRTRSFLFACLAAAVAKSTNADGIRFFENGVVSVNLPVADEVVGARASRTTHPRTLHDFQSFLRRVLEKDIVVDNPFFWNTKKDIVAKVARSKDPQMIALSRSCAHSRFTPNSTWHCGTCSQCIDRRIAVIAAEAEAFDEASDYEVDVFTGPRKEGYEQNMALDYVRLAKDLNDAGVDGISHRFSDEIVEANRFLGRSRESAERLCSLLSAHGKIVSDVVSSQIAKNSERFLEGNLPSSCMIRLVAGNRHRIESWQRLSDTIVTCLRNGLPAACSDAPPKKETDLQRLCDGLLKAAGERLEREFPYARWGLIGTKPDWSSNEINLWIELKYARKQSATPGRISDEIATDITKYGDAGKRVLFLIYDPDRLIRDDAEFVEPIHSHSGMRAEILR